MIRIIFKDQPWLRYYNKHNLSDRIQAMTNNDMFFAYNTLKDRYELHSILSYRYNGYSENAVLDERLLNSWILRDYRANEIKRFKDEVAADREYREKFYDQHEEKNFGHTIKHGLKAVENLLGREL